MCHNKQPWFCNVCCALLLQNLQSSIISGNNAKEQYCFAFRFRSIANWRYSYMNIFSRLLPTSSRSVASAVRPIPSFTPHHYPSLSICDPHQLLLASLPPFVKVVTLCGWHTAPNRHVTVSQPAASRDPACVPLPSDGHVAER